MSEIKNTTVSKVLETFTNETIQEAFTQIENKIANLISVTSKDFLKLNDKFKLYYNDIKEISNQSSVSFEEITSENQSKYIESLNDNSKRYHDILESVEYQIEKCFSILKNINKNFNVINLNILNYKQNLKTLKFLITNLKLVSVTSESQQSFDTINKLINSITTIYPCFDENFKVSNKMYQNSLKTIESLKEKIDTSKRLLTHFSNAILNAENKFNEALRILPQLNENSNKCSIGLESIITNLQFQDIVSQKIDHIKKTHNQILEKLANENTAKLKDSFQIQKARTYVQISDICGLQAAQLIHSNKEYQHALSTITTKFSEIGEVIESIYNICHDFFEDSSKKDGFTVSDLLNDLNSYSAFAKEINLISNIFELQIESLILKSESIIECFNKIDEFTKHLKEFNNTINEVNQRSGAKRLSQNNIKQIASISDELEKTANTLFAIKSDNQKLMKFLRKEFHDVYLKNNHEKNVSQLNKESEEHVRNIVEIYRHANTILTSTLSNSSSIAGKIKNAFDEVEYYDLFESETENIIQILNNLHSKLREEDKLALRNSEDLENIKDNYTVDSEHKVHDSFTNNIDSIKNVLFDDSLFTGNESKNDENLELF
jgi:transposase-like protein